MIDLKQLEYFIACVQNGSISKAAQELYTSQPHVSEVIKKLEHSLSTVILSFGKWNSFDCKWTTCL